MSKKKVRPMVDKELRDEVVGYCGGAGSFNEALRWYIKGHKRLTTKNKGQSELITILKGQVADLEANERDSVVGMNNQLMFTKMELQGTKSHAVSLMLENQALKNQLKRDADELHKLKQDIAKLHNEKVNLEKWSSGVEQRNASLMDEICGDRRRYTERVKLSLCYGASIGLIVGIVNGYLFL